MKYDPWRIGKRFPVRHAFLKKDPFMTTRRRLESYENEVCVFFYVFCVFLRLFS